MVCDLLGPDALEDKKTRWGRRLDMIGFTMDLDTQRVSIAEKNVLRAIFGFFLVGERRGTIAVRTLERLASWGSRYSIICVLMVPFTSVLYAAQAGRNRNASVPLTDDLWRICRLFQALLALSMVDETRFARSFSSFDGALCPLGLCIEFDASLSGGGGLIFTILNGVETLVGAFIIDLLPLQFGSDAQYQNCAEFITAVVGIRIARNRGLDVRSILLRGDSVTALQWAETGHFRGTRVTQAACVYVFQAAICGIERVETFHLGKEVNTRADDLSRNVPWKEVQERYKELRGAPLLQTETAELIKLCDPKRKFGNDAEFAEEWGKIMRLLEEGTPS